MPELTFSSFGAGLWLPSGREFAIPRDALLTADNIEYLRSGGVIGRRGRSPLNSTALDGGDPVRALWRHYPRTGTKNTLAFVDVGASVTLYKADDNSGTFASATTGLPDDARWNFANWPAKNKTFVVNTTGTLREWNGTALSSTTASGSNEVNLAKFGPYIALHKSRLWVTHVDELNFSVYASNVTDETTFLSTNQLSVNDAQGGKITGLASFFDFLLIFKETSLFRFVGDIGTLANAQLALYSDVGCIAPDSVSVTPYGVIFVGRDGVYLTDGVSPNPAELSLPIRSLFVGRSTDTIYANAVGAWYPKRDQYVLKLDPTDSEVYTLTRVNLLSDNPFVGERSRVAWVWARHSNLPAISMSVWDSETDDGRLITGDSAGIIHIHDTGTDDNGTAITAKIQTASVPIDNERDARFRTGRARRIKVLHRASNTVNGEVLYDQASPGAGVSVIIGDTTLAEKFTRSTLGDLEKWGRFVSVELENTSSDADFEVHAIVLDTKLYNRRVWRDENTQEVDVAADQGNIVISGTNTEAAVTFSTAQPDTNYEIAFGLLPSANIGPTTVGIKPGTKSTTGFTAEVGGAPGVGEQYTVMWILSRD